MIIGFVTFIIWGSLFVALLSVFNWDIIALIEWIIGFIWNIILTLADNIAGNRTFRQITS